MRSAGTGVSGGPPPARARLGALALAAAGVLFLLYPALRPWFDETTAAGAAAAMGSGRWVPAHVCAMLGFVLVPLGLRAVSSRAAVVAGLGAGFTLPYYGAEAFALHALSGRADLLDVAAAIRFEPAAVTMFGVGLVLLAVSGVLTAVAAGRPGVLFALGLVLFLPQFFAPAPVRIGHGVLLAAGCVWLAASILRPAPGHP